MTNSKIKSHTGNFTKVFQEFPGVGGREGDYFFYFTPRIGSLS